MTGIGFVPFPYNRVFISSSRRHLSCSQVTLEVSDPEGFTGTVWGASIAFAGVLSSCASLFFIELWLLWAPQSDLGEAKFPSFPPPSFYFNEWVTNICTEQRDKQLRSSQCLGPCPESDEGFFPPLTLFDSHSYKVKGRLTSVLSCFRLLNLRFSVPDVLKIMCGDLTPISSWLWNPGRLDYEHNSAAFFLRLPEKHPQP